MPQNSPKTWHQPQVHKQSGEARLGALGDAWAAVLGAGGCDVGVRLSELSSKCTTCWFLPLVAVPPAEGFNLGVCCWRLSCPFLKEQGKREGKQMTKYLCVFISARKLSSG